MIIRVKDYRAWAEGQAGFSGGQNDALRVALNRARHVLGFVRRDGTFGRSLGNRKKCEHLTPDPTQRAMIFPLGSHIVPLEELTEGLRLFANHLAIVRAERQSKPLDERVEQARRFAASLFEKLEPRHQHLCCTGGKNDNSNL